MSILSHANPLLSSTSARHTLRHMALDEVDFLIIGALALGKSQEDAGKFAVTLDKPSGVTGRTVRTRHAANAEAYSRLVTKLKTEIDRLRQQACDDVRDLTQKEYETAMKGERGKRHQVKRLALDAALMNPDDPEMLKVGLAAAETMDNRDFGKPRQHVDHTVQGAIAVFNAKAADALLREQREITDASMFVQKYLPGDVLEAEIVGEGQPA